MEEKKLLTTEEKRKKRIAQLKAKLQKEEARLNQDKRKERNGQLIAFGVLIEEIFKSGNSQLVTMLEDAAKTRLKDRNLNRALAGFRRLRGESS